MPREDSDTFPTFDEAAAVTPDVLRKLADVLESMSNPDADSAAITALIETTSRKQTMALAFLYCTLADAAEWTPEEMREYADRAADRYLQRPIQVDE